MTFMYRVNEDGKWGSHLYRYGNPFTDLWNRMPDELVMYQPMKFLRYLQTEGYL